MICKYRHAEDSIEDKAVEMRESCMGDTVRSPGAVVIHLWDASARCQPQSNELSMASLPSTFPAMMGPWRLHSIALLTPSKAFVKGHHAPIHLIPLRNGSDLVNPPFPPRINCTRSIITPPNSRNKDVKPYCLLKAQGPWLDIIEQILRRICKEEDKE